MKLKFFSKSLGAIASVALLTFSAWCLAAENTSSESNPATGRTSPQLSYGVGDVLKLAGAKIGESTIVTYIQNSGNSFGGLSASEIVYLHEQGVSDRVVTSMLEQRKRLSEAAAQSATQQNPAATAPTPTAIIAAPPPQVYTPPVVYVQPAPAPSVIVMHDSSPRLVDYGIYPRYGCGNYYPSYGGYGYVCPPVSVSFGFRSGYGGCFSGGFGSVGFSSGGWRGGFRGGYYR